MFSSVHDAPQTDHVQEVSLKYDLKPTLKIRHVDRVFCLLSLAGGRLLVGGSPDGDVHVYDPRGYLEFVIRGHKDTVVNMTVSMEGHLFTASVDRTVREWDIRTFTFLREYVGHLGLIMCLTVTTSASNLGLFTGSDDCTIRRWNTTNGTSFAELKGHKGPINCMAASNAYLYSGSNDKSIRVWEILSHKCLRTINAHTDVVWSIALLMDGRLISSGGDALIKVWQNPVKTGECLHVLTGHKGAVRDLLLYGTTLFSTGRESSVVCWDLSKMQQNEIMTVTDEKMKPTTRTLTSLSLQNNVLCVGGFDKMINCFDVADILPEMQPVLPCPPLILNPDDIDLEDDDDVDRVLEDKHYELIQKPVYHAVLQFTEMPINFIIDSLDLKLRRSKLNREFWLYIAFVIMFVFFFTASRNVEATYYTGEGVKTLIANRDLPDLKVRKGFLDLGHKDDWYGWASGVLVPGLFSGKNFTNEVDPVLVAGQNQLLGAVRFRLIKVRNDSCGISTDFLSDEGLQDPDFIACFGDYKSDFVDTNSFVCGGQDYMQPCTYDPQEFKRIFNTTETLFRYDGSSGASIDGKTKNYQKGGHIVDIPFQLSQSAALDRVNALMTFGFVDNSATRLISVEFFSYNPHSNMFVYHTLFCEVLAGGAWIPSYQLQPFEVWVLSGSVMAYEVIFFVFVLFYFFRYYYLLIQKAMEGKAQLLRYFVNIYNVLELVNTHLFIVMYGYRFEWFRVSEFKRLEFQLPFLASQHSDVLLDLVGLYRTQVALNSLNSILTFMKILKFVSLNYKLNVLTRTLAAAQNHIAGVLAIFVYVMFSFAITAWSMYGSGLWSYRTLDAAFNSLVRALLGDSDYDGMVRENYELTFVFYWTFIIIGLFLMLNFLIAVIGDAFADVSKKQPPISLETAIVKAFEDMRYQCLPLSLRRSWILMKHSKDQQWLVAQALAELKKDRDSKLSPEDLEAGIYSETERVVVSREDFLNRFGHSNTVTTQVGLREFFYELWKSVAFEYYHQLKDEEALGRHDRENLIRDVLGRGLVVLQSSEEEYLEDIHKRLKQYEAQFRAHVLRSDTYSPR